MPDDSETAMPMASATWSTGSFISLQQAAVVAMTPMMPVMCQPPSLPIRKPDRLMRAATSQPTMKAPSTSAGVAFVVSATGSSAGITAATDWPLRKVKS